MALIDKYNVIMESRTLTESRLPSLFRYLSTEQIEVIERDCGPWLAAAGGEIAWRGLDMEVRIDSDTPMVRRRVRTNRKPRDTPQSYHDEMRSAIESAGLTANRHNSIFCTGDHQTAQEYAYNSTAAVFPIGEFRYTWSEFISDPANMGRNEYPIDDTTWQGDNGTLEEAIQSGHEIMIACDEVWLIHFDALSPPHEDGDEDEDGEAVGRGSW